MISPPEEKVQLRIHGAPGPPTLIYLPGLHGDWTLVGAFRRAFLEQPSGARAAKPGTATRPGARFVDLCYPRTLEWSLEDYAAGIERALAEQGITRGWLLGESFGSQVLWALVARERFQIDGIILAGGFVRHPAQWGVRVAERVTGGVSLTLLTRILFGYAKIARFRYRHAPEVLTGIREFIQRRTELDRQAAKHRLHLIAGSDPRAVAARTRVPVYGLTGVLDPIVPWCCVRPWLRRNCPSLRDYRVLWHADHNVLGTAPDAAAEWVAKWIA